ncbi:hypothetical protein PCE1_001360 [Barthelona sp. PCE]
MTEFPVSNYSPFVIEWANNNTAVVIVDDTHIRFLSTETKQELNSVELPEKCTVEEISHNNVTNNLLVTFNNSETNQNFASLYYFSDDFASIKFVRVGSINSWIQAVGQNDKFVEVYYVDDKDKEDDGSFIDLFEIIKEGDAITLKEKIHFEFGGFIEACSPIVLVPDDDTPLPVTFIYADMDSYMIHWGDGEPGNEVIDPMEAEPFGVAPCSNTQFFMRYPDNMTSFKTTQEMHSFPLPDPQACIDITSDGKYMVSATDNGIVTSELMYLENEKTDVKEIGKLNKSWLEISGASILKKENVLYVCVCVYVSFQKSKAEIYKFDC